MLPRTPEVPSTRPSRRIGSAPCLEILGHSLATRPRRISVPACSRGSPLGHAAKPADATALPCEPSTVHQVAPAMWWKAPRRQPASQGATLLVRFLSCTRATAPASMLLAAARVRTLYYPPAMQKTCGQCHLRRQPHGRRSSRVCQRSAVLSSTVSELPFVYVQWSQAIMLFPVIEACKLVAL